MNRMQLSRIWIISCLIAVFLIFSAGLTCAQNITISGTVRTVTGTGVGSITIRASNGQTTSTTVDGTYSLSLPGGWSGSIAPEGQYLMQPQRHEYNNVTTNITDQDFVASPKLYMLYSNSLTAVKQGDIASGDFNGDGKMDIVVAGLEHDKKTGNLVPSANIWRNEGASGFTQLVAGLTGVKNPALAWGDYDNDGKLDVIITGDTGSALVTRLYRNDDNSWPVVTEAVLPGVKHGDIAWADFDNDGKPDLLIAGEAASGRITKLFRNNGDGSFTELGVSGLPGVSQCSVAWADFDNDGRMDFAIAGNSDSGPVTKIFRNDGAGQFSDINAGLTGVGSASISWGDYDHDGLLDLAIAGERADSVKITRICRNTGSGFDELDLGLPGVTGTIMWGDYNNDGHLDLALAGPQGPAETAPKICHNNGDGTFIVYPITNSEIGLSGLKMVWTDFNKDNKLDLILCAETNGSYAGTLTYNNVTATANTAPGAPSGLSATFDNNTLTMSWSAAIDPNTPADGLSYNIRVGTSPGADDVFSGMADLSTGRRNVLAPGNAGFNLTWKLCNLVTRNYYWSVQAVDSGYMASAWAAEAMVNPDSSPPVIGISAPSASLTNVGPVSYTITYQGADFVTLSNTDVSLNVTGTANGTVSVSGTGTSARTVTISNITGDGTIGISIAAGSARNFADDYAPGAGPSATFTVDNLSPVINISAPSASITRQGPVSYTITYDGCDSITLAQGDVTLNKTGTANGTVSVSGTGLAERTVTIDNITGNGSLSISIAAETGHSTAGNHTPAVGPGDAFEVDNTPPVIEIGEPSATITSAGPVTFEVTYSDATLITLSEQDVVLNKTGTADGTVSVTGSDPGSRTVTISDITGDGALGISINAGTAADDLGNTAPAAGPSDTFDVDNTAPSLTIGEPSEEITRAGPVTFEITYNNADSVSLSDEDITLNLTGTAQGTASVSGTGLTDRTVTITDITGDGTICISIAAGTAADDLQNPAAAVGPSATFVVDNTAPTAVNLSVDKTITNGPDVIATFDGSTDANGVSYELKVNDGDYEAATSPSRVVPLKFDDGVHTIYVRALDPAGNVGPAASAQFTYDKTPPQILSFSYSPSLVSAGDMMAARVEATDNFEVVNVIADGVYLTKGDDGVWTGNVVTAEALGSHTVYVLAYDEAGNSGSVGWTYKTARAVGLTNRALTDPIISAASDKFVFTVWGRVTVTGDPNNFLVDDGSGKFIKVHYKNHNLSNTDYVSARGAVDVSSNPPTLNAYVVKRHN